MRTTKGYIQHKVNAVNSLLGIDADAPYATPGRVLLGAAYGGYRVEQVMNDHGGIRVLSGDGYGPLKLTGIFLDGMMHGLRADEPTFGLRAAKEG